MNHLQVAVNKWIQMNFSIAHKLHLLIAHAIPVIRLHEGASFLSEGRIERTHQSQTRDNDLVKRIASEDRSKESKAKRQAIRNSVNVSSQVSKVNESCKRKK